jgi:hypothetical protein
MLDPAYFSPLGGFVMLAFAVLYMENKEDCSMLVTVASELLAQLDDDDDDRPSYIDGGPNAKLTNAILTVFMTFLKAGRTGCQECSDYVCHNHRKKKCNTLECLRGKKPYEKYCIDEALFTFYYLMPTYGLGLLARIEKCNEGDTSRITEAIHNIKSMVEDMDTTLHESLQPTVIDDNEHGACLRLLRILRKTTGDAARIIIDNYEKDKFDTDLCIQREYHTEFDGEKLVKCFTVSTGFTWISMHAEHSYAYGCIPDLEHAVVIPNVIRRAASKFFQSDELVFHMEGCVRTDKQVLNFLLSRFPNYLRMKKTSCELSSIGNR